MPTERTTAPHKCPKCGSQAPSVTKLRVIEDPILAIDHVCGACSTQFTQIYELLYTKVVIQEVDNGPKEAPAA